MAKRMAAFSGSFITLLTSFPMYLAGLSMFSSISSFKASFLIGFLSMSVFHNSTIFISAFVPFKLTF